MQLSSFILLATQVQFPHNLRYLWKRIRRRCTTKSQTPSHPASMEFCEFHKIHSVSALLTHPEWRGCEGAKDFEEVSLEGTDIGLSDLIELLTVTRTLQSCWAHLQCSLMKMILRRKIRCFQMNFHFIRKISRYKSMRISRHRHWKETEQDTRSQKVIQWCRAKGCGPEGFSRTLNFELSI